MVPVQFAKIILVSTLGACAYGIVQDQVTIRVCFEYFTIGHPRIFGTQSPTFIALGWGIIATWWAGASFGVALALSARLGRWPKLTASGLLKPIGVLLLIMGGAAIAFGVIGYVLTLCDYVWLLEPLASRVPSNLHPIFLADLWAHTASYVVGFLGGSALCLWALWTRRKLHEHATSS